jgi:PAS domain S-box-containing protein
VVTPNTLSHRALIHSTRYSTRLFAAVGVFMALYLLGLQFTNAVPRQFVAPALIAVTSLTSLVLHYRIGPRTSVLAFVWGIWLTIVLQAVLRNGVAQPALYGLPALFLLAGWVLGMRHGFVLAFMSMLAVVALAAIETAGLLDMRVIMSPWTQAMPIVLVLLASLAAMAFILKQHWRELEQTEQLNQSLEGTVAQLRMGEEALQRSEQRFYKITASNPLPVAVNRLSDGRYLYVNDAWCRTFGWEAKQAIGQTSHALKFWLDRSELVYLMDEFRRQGRLNNEEMSANTASGQVLELLLNAEYIEFDGEPALLAIMLDQTERKRMDKEVRSLNAELELRVQERTAELSHTLDMLKRSQDELVHAEKLASLGSLVAGVAHELNTPIGNALVSASTLADMTRDFREQYTRGELRRSALEAYLAQCEDGCLLTQRSLFRANELVHSFKQVAVDQSSERRRAFDLAAMVQEVVETVRPNTKGKPWTIALDIAPGIAMESYPGPLGQVLINLLMNALLHAFDGREAGEVLLQAGPARDGQVTLVCGDNGCGIASEHLPRIFDPFFTTKLGQGGSGLGLAIVHRLVTQVLHGDIAVESTPGQGTRFVLRLPLEVAELEI